MLSLCLPYKAEPLFRESHLRSISAMSVSRNSSIRSSAFLYNNCVGTGSGGTALRQYVHPLPNRRV